MKFNKKKTSKKFSGKFNKKFNKKSTRKKMKGGVSELTIGLGLVFLYLFGMLCYTYYKKISDKVYGDRRFNRGIANAFDEAFRRAALMDEYDEKIEKMLETIKDSQSYNIPTQIHNNIFEFIDYILTDYPRNPARKALLHLLDDKDFSIRAYNAIFNETVKHLTYTGEHKGNVYITILLIINKILDKLEDHEARDLLINFQNNKPYMDVIDKCITYDGYLEVPIEAMKLISKMTSSMIIRYKAKIIERLGGDNPSGRPPEKHPYIQNQATKTLMKLPVQTEEYIEKIINNISPYNNDLTTSSIELLHRFDLKILKKYKTKITDKINLIRDRIAVGDLLVKQITSDDGDESRPFAQVKKFTSDDGDNDPVPRAEPVKGAPPPMRVDLRLQREKNAALQPPPRPASFSPEFYDSLPAGGEDAFRQRPEPRRESPAQGNSCRRRPETPGFSDSFLRRYAEHDNPFCVGGGKRRRKSIKEQFGGAKVYDHVDKNEFIGTDPGQAITNREEEATKIAAGEATIDPEEATTIAAESLKDEYVVDLVAEDVIAVYKNDEKRESMETLTENILGENYENKSYTKKKIFDLINNFFRKLSSEEKRKKIKEIERIFLISKKDDKKPTKRFLNLREHFFKLKDRIKNRIKNLYRITRSKFSGGKKQKKGKRLTKRR